LFSKGLPALKKIAMGDNTTTFGIMKSLEDIGGIGGGYV
jgi:hypothetical protein